MFGTIRKHQKWLWGIIIAVVIVSFVVFFSPNVGLETGSRNTLAYINGRSVLRPEYFDAYREAQLRYLFSYGNWPKGGEAGRFGFDAERETLNRLFLIEKIKANKIIVGDEAAAEWIKRVPFFVDRERKVFRPEIYDNFVRNVLRKENVTDLDMERFARHEVGIQELITVYGASGKLVTPREAEALFRTENEELLTQVVLFNTSNYLAKITIGTNDLETFFTNRLSFYRIPERVQLAYVKFEITNFFADAEQQMAKDTNLALRINKAYLERGTNVFVDTDGKVMSEAVAKEKIRKEAKDAYALQAARRKAGEFGIELEKSPSKTLAAMEQLATSKELAVKEMAPFNQTEGPQETNAPENLVRVAFALTPEDPISSSPMVGEDGVFIIGLKKKLPSEMPALESVKAKVTEDYRAYQAGNLCRQTGYIFGQTVTNGLAQKKTFEALCAEAQLKPIDLPKFSGSTQSLPEADTSVDFARLKDAASRLTAGQASTFIGTREGGFVVYVKARTPVDDARVKAEVPAFMANLRKSRQYEAFGEWMNQEMQSARVSGYSDNTKTKKP